MADIQYTTLKQWMTTDLQVKLLMIYFVIADAGNNILDYLLHAQIYYSTKYAVDEWPYK